MGNIVAIRHVAFEALGTAETVLSDRGSKVSYIDVGKDLLTEANVGDPDLLVILGAPVSVYARHIYPFIDLETAIVRRRLLARRPTLGICFGAQLMAHVLGATVYPMKAKEIGWSNVELSVAGRDSPFSLLAKDHVKVFHWHGDTFDLPEGATLLASTPACPNQVFRYGDHALGLQFHVEVKSEEIERWLIGHAAELANSRMDVLQLRSDTEYFGPTLSAIAPHLFSEIFDSLGTR